MSTVTEQRTQAVASAIAQMKSALGEAAPTRPALADVLASLEAIAAQPEFWQAADFPPPEPGEADVVGALRELEEETVEGTEVNRVYERTDDGSVAGRGTLRETAHVLVEPGHGIALMPEDIHSVQIEGEQVIRHLHMYGRALETLTERTGYDLDKGTCQTMGIGVQTRR